MVFRDEINRIELSLVYDQFRNNVDLVMKFV